MFQHRHARAWLLAISPALGRRLRARLECAAFPPFMRKGKSTVYLLAILLPPLAVLLCGKPIQAILNALLTCCWIPGVIHRCSSFRATRQTAAIASLSQAYRGPRWQGTRTQLIQIDPVTTYPNEIILTSYRATLLYQMAKRPEMSARSIGCIHVIKGTLTPRPDWRWIIPSIQPLRWPAHFAAGCQ